MGPQFFIRRPRFALVISILITIFGIMASIVMPVDQYPDIAAPKVVVRANYPGASAETVKEALEGPGWTININCKEVVIRGEM